MFVPGGHVLKKTKGNAGLSSRQEVGSELLKVSDRVLLHADSSPSKFMRYTFLATSSQ